MKSKIALIVLLACFRTAFAQVDPLQIGQWREHVPFDQVHTVAEAGDLIYAATNYALFTYNKSTNELNRLSKINGLTSSGITTVAYFDQYDLAIVGYADGNLDFIQDNNIYNVPDIKNANLVADKRINKVLAFDSLLYFCTGFGIALMDPIEWEFLDKYTMPNDGTFLNVYDLDRDSVFWFAAAQIGVYKALREGVNLLDFREWKQQYGLFHPWTRYQHLIYANDTMYVNANYQWDPDTIYYHTPQGWFKKSSDIVHEHHTVFEVDDGKILVGCRDTLLIYHEDFQPIDTLLKWSYGGEVYPNHAFFGEDGLLHIADNQYGLVLKDIETGTWNKATPSGPTTTEVFDLSAGGGHVYFSRGGRTRTNGNNFFQPFEINYWDGASWQVIIEENNGFDLSKYRDIVGFAQNRNDPSEIYMASLTGGAVQMENEKVVAVYNDSNSTLTRWVHSETFSLMSLGDVAYDYEGNIWFAVTNVPEALTVQTTNGEWYNFSPEGLHAGRRVDHLLIDQYGQKWLSQTESTGGGLLVFTENKTYDYTGDDQSVTLNATIGSGSLPSNGITALAEDHDGEIWIGTTAGLGVIFSPSQVFTPQGVEAQQLLINQGGYTQYLLEGQEITSIAIDGANRKWIGTAANGVFVISEDGSEEVAHFTLENSGLFANSITGISIDQSTGEVYIGTGSGLVSYMGEATSGFDGAASSSVYPNPVPSGYDGPIVVEGLLKDTEVTITDASGNYVNAARSLGGRMVWDGKDVNGERVQSGVYVFLGISEDGTHRTVGKVAFIH